jgi:acetyltransferase-like isoleucine patch superfamily enzyme
MPTKPDKLDDVPREIFDRTRSARAKYQALMVGRPGWGPLLRYEFVTSVAGRLPGALGLFLRSRLYPGLFARCGRNVFFGTDVVLRHPHKISIGHDVVIDDGCVLDAKGTSNKGITIGDGVFIGRHSSLNTKDGDIVIEDRVNIGPFCTVFSASTVRIGQETLLAAYAYLVGGGHAFDDVGTPILDQPRPSAGITVGPSSWIGTAVTVLDGVTIGRGVVVGANAVVTRNLPDLSVAAGTPAVVHRTREAPPGALS